MGGSDVLAVFNIWKIGNKDNFFGIPHNEKLCIYSFVNVYMVVLKQREINWTKWYSAKNEDFEVQQSCMQILSLPFTGCMHLGKLFNLSESQYSRNSYFLVLLSRCNGKIYTCQ